jgi:thioredoxin
MQNTFMRSLLFAVLINVTCACLSTHASHEASQGTAVALAKEEASSPSAEQPLDIEMLQPELEAMQSFVEALQNNEKPVFVAVTHPAKTATDEQLSNTLEKLRVEFAETIDFAIIDLEQDRAIAYFIFGIEGAQHIPAFFFVYKAQPLLDKIEGYAGIDTLRVSLRALNEQRARFDQQETALQREFSELILNNPTPTVLCFSSPLYEQCESMKPIVTECAHEYVGTYNFIDLDCEQNYELARMLGVDALPTFIFIKDGAFVFRFAGQITKELFGAVLGKAFVQNQSQDELYTFLDNATL